MTITLKCPCGKSFRAKSEHAGKKMKCSACGQILIIPRPTARESAVDLGNPATLDLPSLPPNRFPSATRQTSASQLAKKKSVSPIVAYSVGGGIVVIGLAAILAIALLPSKDVTVGEAIAGDEIAREATGGDGVKKGDQGDSQVGNVFAGEADRPGAAVPGHPVLPVYPGLPGAVKHAPAFLLADAPFDIAKFFESPPADQNAAPLYLDALFEFSSDVSVCFTEPEQQQRRPIADERLKRAYSIHMRRDQNENSVSAQELDAALEELAAGFEKLDAAQQKPQCVFESGLGLAALLPHVHAAREVHRWTDIKTQRDLELGQWDDAQKNIERMLRLSRDLRRRGISISQLASVAIDTQAFEGPVKRLLAAPGLSTEQCDRLLATLVQHEQQAVDSAVEGLRSEYVLARTVLHEVQHRIGDFDPKFMREEINNDSIGGVITGLLMSDSLPAATIDTIVARMTDDDYANEVAKVNAVFKSLTAVLDHPYGERARSIEAVKSGFRMNETPLAYLLIPEALPMLEAFVRSQAQLHGTQCLVMLRRWQLDQPGKRPPDLASVVKAAGMNAIPRDPYGDGPLRMAPLGNETVIYSIGSDGQDQKAAADWNHGQQPGDFIFRMTRTP